MALESKSAEFPRCKGNMRLGCIEHPPIHIIIREKAGQFFCVTYSESRSVWARIRTSAARACTFLR